MGDREGYRQLDEHQILETISRLAHRVEERFPDSGLARVCRSLLTTGEEARNRLEFLRRPQWTLRLVAGFFMLLLLALVVLTVIGVGTILTRAGAPGIAGSVAEAVQAVESLVQEAVFVSIAIWFLFRLEIRLKRRRALSAIHELRSVAHIIDMHQLTKDPEQMLSKPAETASSPERGMSRQQLGRYLEYCSEMLSLTSKLAALHVQHLNDPVVLEAVSDVEDLTGTLSATIWQKIALLERIPGVASPAGEIPH